MQNEITLDQLNSGENISFTYTPMDGLGTGGTVEVYGNKLCGRIAVNTGSNCEGRNLCRINLPEGENYGTDTIRVFIQSTQGDFFQVVAQGREGNGFDIYSKELWESNRSYDFEYFVIARIQ